MRRTLRDPPVYAHIYIYIIYIYIYMCMHMYMCIYLYSYIHIFAYAQKIHGFLDTQRSPVKTSLFMPEP